MDGNRNAAQGAQRQGPRGTAAESRDEAGAQEAAYEHTATTGESAGAAGQLEASLREAHEAVDALGARVASLGLQHRRMSDAIAVAAERIALAQQELVASVEAETTASARLCAARAANCALERRLGELLKLQVIKDDRL
eukprot:m51a1_g14322 hypothetical protein (139) ;mRNA; f:35666-36082